MPVGFEHPLPSGECEITGSNAAAPTWQHSRHTVFLVCLCILIGLTAMISSQSAPASPRQHPRSLISVITRPGSAVKPASLERSNAGASIAVPHEARRGRTIVVPPRTTTTIPGGAMNAVVANTGDPNVRSVSPSTVSAGGGATVQITGTGFGSASAVYFGTNTSSDFSVVSPRLITAMAPTNAGSVNVAVVTPGGISADNQASQITYAPTGQLPITVSGQNLEMGGVPTKFTGVNAYELATSWGTNAGCGGTETAPQIAALFSSLGPNSMVRFWAFQGTLATNPATHQIDWAPIDQVFYLAAHYHVYLVPAITDQGGGCDGGHWQDPSWYAGGFNDVFNSLSNSDGRGLTPLSYWTYMQELVSRYKDSPALGLWEPISEPEASTCTSAFQPTNCSGNQTCPDESAAAADLTSFFDVVGGEIHTLDPIHPVEAGFLGGGQCGTQGTDYESVGASPGIDVLSVHDYYGAALLGGDQWNGMSVRFSQAATLDKPIITGEVGILAGNGHSCISFDQRVVEMTAKRQAQFADGSSAFLVWNWVLDPLGSCNYNTGTGDPLMASLAG
jgi:mannan endo-1,4-beta-mannosidase